ncbi:hypothetical protein [Nonomuraea recticatena]|uniref:hypothetical protein n=1 Tax=Nonomuraea recticatena TaxID=46178 RepID=UPI00361A8438
MTLDDLSGSQLSTRRLTLLEDGVDATAQELRDLAAMLGCSPLVLRHGLTADRGAQIRQEGLPPEDWTRLMQLMPA